MKTRSVATNAFLNVLRTVLALIGPLITYPYVSRILGATNLGKVNYVNSIVQYFVLFAALGISTYGVREGAKKRNNKTQVNNFISECFTINFIMAIISSVVLLLIVFNVEIFADYKTLFLIEGLLIAFDLFGIEWVNTVFEDYLYITIRTIVIYCVSIVLTFLLIHKESDYYLFAVLSVGTTGLVSLLNWIHCRKVCTVKIRISIDTKAHIKPILVFFANKLAVSLYVSADTTMLGMMTSDYRVGIYSVAVKIYTIIKNMLAAIYAVCIPRLSSKIGKNDDKGFKELYSEIVSIMTLLIFPASIGLYFLAPNIILLMFGEKYIESSISLQILSFAIIFAIYGGVVSSVFNTTKNLEKISLQATIIAALSNIGLNYLLIPRFQEYGAAFTTVLAEGITFIYCFIRAEGIREYLDLAVIKKCVLEALAGCIEIVVVYCFVHKYTDSNIFVIGFTILGSCVLYTITLVLTKNRYVQMVYSRIKRK